ncbi:MFS transporter [Olivibacter sp. SDN3]|uniref:MFS transporter n=1 Tax=Olivibacter sp. SDN3 TaxID=2764720 RepID=UPI002102DEB6|nr:MFS transporter [Olivibacter sp. SDN3]
MKNRHKWEPLLWLWLAFFLNQADRQIFGVVLPLIKVDLDLTDTELGLIASALIWAYGLLVPIAGFVGDRYSRRNLIGFCLFFWSTATLLTGFCHTVMQFVLLRGIATGGGEAFYAPAANAYISERYQKQRSFALSLHQSAVYFGIVLSGLIAGRIAESYGWRNAFYVFGAMGVLLAVVIFLRMAKDLPQQVEDKVSIASTLAIIGKKPTVLLLTFAFGCMVFVNVGYLTWMPSLLVEKFNLSIPSAGFNSMIYHHVGAFTGVIIGGYVSDRLARKTGKNRLTLQAIALACGVPFIYFVGAAGTIIETYLTLFVFGVFRGIYDANIFASLYEVIAPKIRSSAAGVMLMMAFLVGSFSPLLMGILKPFWGLSFAFSMLSVSYALGAVAIGLAVKFCYANDSYLPKIAPAPLTIDT